MKKHLISEKGKFYKANLHCHTTLSDGRKTPEEVKEIYKNLGYSIVAYTDHDILIPHDDLTDDEFLALHGFEMEINEEKEAAFMYIKTCHICFIGIEPENITQPMWHRSKYLFAHAPEHKDEVKFDENEPDYERRFGGEGISDIMKRGREKGFFVTYNHPTWSMEDYSDYIGYEGMHAFEMFNGGCISGGYEDYNPRVYDDILRSGKKIYCIGADDNHNAHPADSRRFDSGWAWTMIKAEDLSYRSVTKALEEGQFYASEGPEIYDLWYEDGKVYINCSDSDRITCYFGVRRVQTVLSEEGEAVSSASFTLPEDFKYFRITVVDKKGRHACTNAYFSEDFID